LLRLSARAVLVVGMLLHVDLSQSLGLVDEGSLVVLAQLLPLRAQPAKYLRVVHLGVLLCHLPALAAAPHHKSVHRTLDAAK
ncbi:hypothetical protein PFISCL1PPCAC_22899, partial [Pristionchus fissidentatus]